MNNKMAQRSKDISSKMKDELIKQASFIEKNAHFYLELYSIDNSGNGLIVESHNDEKAKPQNISFVSADSIQASYESINKVGILVSCSHRRAGGGWLSGSIAQEENISRCSTWAFQANLEQFKSWYNQNLWYGQKGALVIDGLLIFNEKNEELSQPKEVVFAGVAAANKASLNNDDYWNSEKGFLERKNSLVHNLVCAFNEFEKRGVQDVILCAFGTNVFGWTLEESIQVLHEATKYASTNLNFICAISSEEKLKIAEVIYKDITNANKQQKRNIYKLN